ncbi:hypothetical protein SLEP1_g45542 [Rubroshorea leprosula]|uniref:Reverse transcriptase domain-containing protein n=1 Tax=Rubroshorea leprosula TaxID=152421 RepID=A0AAV5LJG0_9ROSI|nr:hypothetical protein SLEP1_g45542 [Rubroshorea leprosula]
MWSTFGKYGWIISIYSPQRRSKSGGRFGFVRFLEVRNVMELESQLDQIRIEGRKLWVNLAKYLEERGEKEKVRIGIIENKDSHGKSYADAVRGEQGGDLRKTRDQMLATSLKFEPHKQPKQRREWKMKNREEEWSGMEYTVKEEDFEWLKGCYVGIARSVEIVLILQERFYMEGYFSCSLRAMGGKMVLMECEDKEELKDFVQHASDWLGQWFLEVTPWSPSMVAKERFVWIRCQGAPLHAWGPKFFESMASVWGKFISLDDSTSKRRRFDIARFLISTTMMEAISVKRKIQVNGAMYELKFTEEELTNSLFSLKYDFMPSFNNDQEDDESWFEDTDYDEGCDEISKEADKETTAGEKEVAGDNIECEGRGSRLVVALILEEKFELDGIGNDETQFYKGDSPFQSRVGEEETVEMVADSFDMEIEEDDVDDRERVGECEAEFEKGRQMKEEESVIRKLEEMEKRDRATKEAENARRASEVQKETKKCGLDRNYCKRLWHSEDFEWVGKDSVGRSRGLLCVWNSKTITVKHVWEGENFIGIQGVWIAENVVVNVVNVYSPCQLAGKRILWLELKNLVLQSGGMWCVVGDFNAVRKVKEKIGSGRLTTEMGEFDNFIRDSGLIDIPLVGRKFTWYQTGGKFMSRIDRALLSEEWLSTWGEATQWGLSRIVSDHCPILLRHKKVNWGPKPFRFFDIWLEQKECRELIRKAWEQANIQGWAGFQLKEKLKITKEALKKWSKSFVPEIDNRIKKATAQIEQYKESMLQQKARKAWLSKGDENTKFFHSCVKGRWKRNEMNSIQIKGIQYTEARSMKEEIASFFQNMFAEEQWKRPTLEGVKFKRISAEENSSLTTPFTEEEIKTVVWDCESSKAPGPDGDNQRGCHWVFRGILEKWQVGVVGEQQMAFISGRQLMDGVMIANEVVDETKKKKKKAFMLKIDFEKAYDKCLKSSMVSVLVNGSPTRQFMVSRGLWQGDPLSPFLFLIIAKGFNGLASTTIQNGLLKGVEVGHGGFKVSHLQYADDTLLFGEATEENVWAMKGILRTFELVSGLKINFNKSLIIGIGVEEEWLDKMAWIMCCKKGNLPFKYLGIPIGGTILSLDKIRRRFLWGGIEGGKKINWVKWDTVCKDKELGGLGVKDLRKFNLALLGKWSGILVNKDEGLWKKVIVEKYRKEGEPSYNWLRENIGYGSTWWRDICRLNSIECKHEGWLVEGWLVEGFKIRVGDGGSIKFWWDEWCGEGQLVNRFPRLYLLSAGKDFKVSQSGGWLNGTWIWHLEWRRGLHSWEEQEVSELMKMINDITITRGKEDIWEWSHSKDGDYSSKSAYQALTREHGTEQQ